MLKPVSRVKKSPGRPPLVQNQDREGWQIQMRPDLILNLRKLALERRCSPYDVLGEAVEYFLRDQTKRRQEKSK